MEQKDLIPGKGKNKKTEAAPVTANDSLYTDARDHITKAKVKSLKLAEHRAKQGLSNPRVKALAKELHEMEKVLSMYVKP